MDIVIREGAAADLEAVHAMNQAARPAVGDETPETLAAIVEMAAYFRVAERDGRLVGFLIGLTPEADYESMNFQWFRRHYDSFAYVDRIVIAEEARGSGLGRRFYEDFEEFARGRAPIVTCEVNTRPRNHVSLSFHSALGFTAVGTQETAGGAKSVVMLSKPVTPG